MARQTSLCVDPVINCGFVKGVFHLPRQSVESWGQVPVKKLKFNVLHILIRGLTSSGVKPKTTLTKCICFLFIKLLNLYLDEFGLTVLSLILGRHYRNYVTELILKPSPQCLL